MFLFFFIGYKTCVPLDHSTHETFKNSYYFHVMDDKYYPMSPVRNLWNQYLKLAFVTVNQ